MPAASRAQKIFEPMLKAADIQVNGTRPWDIQVHDDRFWRRVTLGGSMAFGESYMDGWWDCKELDGLVYRLTKERVREKVRGWSDTWLDVAAWFLNMQTRQRSKRVAREHYDLGNEFYEAFLDPYNQYTCGYFKDTDDLNEAQEKKLHLICRKLQLSKDDRVLDIGCGWGGFAKFASKHYGCHVTGITISEEQIRYAKEYCKGLPVDIQFKDYRDMQGSFDKVLICGMVEHVGYRNYRHIMEVVHRCLKQSGLFLLHTIGSTVSHTHGEPWIEKYIFPNSMLPSVAQVAKAAERLFVMEDLHNFGAYYDKTLLAWYDNFEKAWPRFRAQYGDRFYRMWRYYLLVCAGLFRARSTQLFQFVFSKEGVPGGYASVR